MGPGSRPGRRAFYGSSPGRFSLDNAIDHSGLMPAFCTTSAHFAISELTNLPNSAPARFGVAEPFFAQIAVGRSVSSALRTSAAIFATISGGVPFGANSAYQVD